ncbi:hypothetical protein PV682_28590 [Streptomyces niveiscabiei]|uniref:hypothetical protein n=1 Tax=Streptomyces niveiscabiei TaxID=164115 RepID=UPI0029B7FECF|nr:hypothetical protein [Streptomyces niveiscabiei]MDX3385399.1 hypothetical protein [Streptomyces niveiscabiei]
MRSCSLSVRLAASVLAVAAASGCMSVGDDADGAGAAKPSQSAGQPGGAAPDGGKAGEGRYVNGSTHRGDDKGARDGDHSGAPSATPSASLSASASPSAPAPKPGKPGPGRPTPTRSAVPEPPQQSPEPPTPSPEPPSSSPEPSPVEPSPSAQEPAPGG